MIIDVSEGSCDRGRWGLAWLQTRGRISTRSPRFIIRLSFQNPCGYLRTGINLITVMIMNHRSDGDRRIFAETDKISVLCLSGHMIVWIFFRFIKKRRKMRDPCSSLFWCFALVHVKNWKWHCFYLFCRCLCADHTYEKLKNAMKMGKKRVFDKKKSMIWSKCLIRRGRHWRVCLRRKSR